MNPICQNPACGREIPRDKRLSLVRHMARAFCSLQCNADERKARLADDVAWIVDHDNPINVARRVGWSDPHELLWRLRKNGATAVADKYARSLERYRMEQAA